MKLDSYDNIPSPCFLLEKELLVKNLELIKDVQERSGADIILALKAFAMWRVFPLIGEYLPSATASSLHEARLIFEEMGRKAHVYAPAYLPEEFEKMLGYASHLTFNSLRQYERFKDEVISHPQQVSMGLRVNPQAASSAVDMYNPSLPGSRFGILAEQLGDTLPEGIEGLHLHVLCEADSYALESVLEAFEAKFGHLFPQLKWVNMGGGHLMTRKGYDLEHVVGLLNSFREKHKVEVILEPGSAIAWETGVLVSSVMDIVENHEIKTAILDVSFTAHMPDTLEMPYQPKVLGAESSAIEGKEVYRLGGSSCLSGDFIGDYSFDQPLDVGDKVILLDMIHYTTVKTTMFNGIKHPSLGILKKGGIFELVREFGYEDYKNRLS
ncbi:MAG: carboxynorspermidine decarboxylase [Bacteroidota bacterium]